MDTLEQLVAVAGQTLSVALGLTVVVLMTLYGVRAVRGAHKERRARPVPTDSRHVGAALLIPAAMTSGVVVAGGGWLAILVVALLGAPLGVGMALLAVPPWEDTSRGPWVGGAMFIGLATICVGVAVAVRVF